MDEEVQRWEVAPADYFLYTLSGNKIRITRAEALQPPIRDPEDYPTFLWIQALEGYFLLRQHIVKGKAHPWRIVRRILPEESDPTFYTDFKDRLLDFVEEVGLNVPMKP